MFSEDAENRCPERYWKFQSAIPNQIWVIDEKPPGGLFGSPPSGRGLIENDLRKRMHCNVDDMGTQYDTMLDNITQSVAL